MDSEAAFERIMLPHLDSVYALARRLTGSDAEAEDLAQDTFLRAYRSFGSFELRQYGARPWLFKILHNVFYSRLERRRHQEIQLPEDVDVDAVSVRTAPEAADAVSPAAAMNWDLFDEELKDAVMTLAPEYREVLLLWAMEELSYKEIAEVCGCALGTVMSRLYRARRQIAEKLSDYARRTGIRGNVET